MQVMLAADRFFKGYFEVIAQIGATWERLVERWPKPKILKMLPKPLISKPPNPAPPFGNRLVPEPVVKRTLSSFKT